MRNSCKFRISFKIHFRLKIASSPVSFLPLRPALLTRTFKLYHKIGKGVNDTLTGANSRFALGDWEVITNERQRSFTSSSHPRNHLSYSSNLVLATNYGEPGLCRTEFMLFRVQRTLRVKTYLNLVARLSAWYVTVKHTDSRGWMVPELGKIEILCSAKG